MIIFYFMWSSCDHYWLDLLFHYFSLFPDSSLIYFNQYPFLKQFSLRNLILYFKFFFLIFRLGRASLLFGLLFAGIFGGVFGRLERR